MQGEPRSNLHPYTGICEFNAGSSSNISEMDQRQFFAGGNFTEPLPGDTLSSEEAHYQLMHGDPNPEDLTFGLRSSSGRGSVKHYDAGCGDVKMAQSSSNTRRGGLRIGAPGCEGSNMSSRENMDFDLNANHGDCIQQNDSMQSLGEKLRSTHHAVSRPSYSQHSKGLFASGNVVNPFSSSGSSSGADFFMEDNSARHFVEQDIPCSSRKRKSVEGIVGMSSSSVSGDVNPSENKVPANPFVSQHMSSHMDAPSSSNFSSLHSPEEEQIPMIDMNMADGPVASDVFDFAPASEGSSRISTRTRVPLPPPRTDELPPPDYSSQLGRVAHSSIWAPLPHELSNPFAPPYRSSGPIMGDEGPSSYSPPFVRNENVFPHHRVNGRAYPSVGGSFSSAVIAGEQSAQEELSARNLLSRDFSEHLRRYAPAGYPDSSSGGPGWRLTSEARSMYGMSGSASNAAGAGGSSSQPAPGSGPLSRESPPNEAFPSSAELGRSLFSSSGGFRSRRGPPSTSIYRHGRSSALPEVGEGETSHESQLSLLRASLMAERQSSGSLGASQTPAARREAREASRRMLAEARNMLSLLRRGEHPRFVDMSIFDHPMFLWGAEGYDRHRDMRLDVDNMSYEELLALEERIGNVNTGLSEEVIMKQLKQRIFVSLEPVQEIEPCCICREEYVEGEDLGRLECGHDFHTNCIKQWLVLKNICPICKTAALST